MGQLSEIEVLYALTRESDEMDKRKNSRKYVIVSDIIRRIETEHPYINELSIPVLISRILNRLEKDELINKNKQGREVILKITPLGRNWLSANMDKLDKTKRWFEKPLNGAYFSYAITPPEYGLIHERKDHDLLENTKYVDDFIKKIKKENPELDTLILRLNEEK